MSINSRTPAGTFFAYRVSRCFDTSSSILAPRCSRYIFQRVKFCTVKRDVQRCFFHFASTPFQNIGEKHLRNVHSDRRSAAVIQCRAYDYAEQDHSDCDCYLFLHLIFSLLLIRKTVLNLSQNGLLVFYIMIIKRCLRTRETAQLSYISDGRVRDSESPCRL